MPSKPGPPRQSADVIELHGNASKLSKDEIEKRRAEEVRAAPLRGLKPPDDLRGSARACWKLHAPELERLGLLSKLDVGTFRLACEAYGMAVDAVAAMRPRKSDGTPDKRRADLELVIVDTAHGNRLAKHPAFSIFNMAANTYRSYCIELGLSPSSRVSLRPGTIGKTGPDSASDADHDDDFDFGTG